ncbi:hypothetical protein CC80DRAFT_553370 [Byssothecium circinans]|uniref:Uncharacterized protein n=1 Tax=Byssothecium circinans TaxID=147558 RepID=A0A6A5TIK0_9PLEO|nr:hypothetical protein CC80DRAFT_553370 [Byssothecium circinans]
MAKQSLLPGSLELAGVSAGGIAVAGSGGNKTSRIPYGLLHEQYDPVSPSTASQYINQIDLSPRVQDTLNKIEFVRSSAFILCVTLHAFLGYPNPSPPSFIMFKDAIGAAYRTRTA